MIELQFFVPLKAYFFQIFVLLLGASTLICMNHDLRWKYLPGLSYIVGFTVIGFTQWLTFGLGISSKAIWLLLVIIVIQIIILTYRKLTHKNHADTLKKNPLLFNKNNQFTLLFFIFLFICAFLISQCNDLAETDPRWQWGYRAKIIATEQGLNNDYFQNQNILHTNPRYPLLYSAFEGFQLRVFNNIDAVETFRAIPVFFFISFLLLLLAFAKNTFASWILCLVICIIIGTGKFWSLAIDENYIDFPLGVCAFALVLIMFSCLRNDHGYFLITLLSAVTFGMKNEALILIGIYTLVYAFLAFLHKKNMKIVSKIVFAISVGAILTFCLHRFCLNQINPQLSIENVTISEFSFTTLIANLDRVPNIISSSITHYFSLKNLGFIFPLILLAIPFQKTFEEKVVCLILILYLSIMLIPFMITSYDNNNYLLHMQVVLTRFFFQIIPLSSIVLLSVIRETASQLNLLNLKRSNCENNQHR